MQFRFLPPKSVRPKGWLLRQLKQQGEGLNGNLDKVWRDVRESKWLGGACEGWERLPYFLDGFIPLAYLLDDKDKQARAKRYIDCLLEGQDETGCFYPKGDAEKKNGDIWSLFLILKVLTVYADCSGDERIACHDKRNGIGAVRSTRRTVVELHELGIAVVRRNERRTAGSLDCLNHFLNARVHRADRFLSRRHNAGMSDHIAVGKVEYENIHVSYDAERLFGHFVCAHVRL